MPRQTRRFRRPSGERRYRKLFLLRTEGDKTEPQYFRALDSLVSGSHVVCLRGGHASAPPQVLRHMKTYLMEQRPASPYEAWLIVDRDQWSNAQLASLDRWERQQSNYGLAISNPKFEHWLLLHFEDGNNIGSARECSDRLKQYLPDYDKDIDIRAITLDRIQDAVSRAKDRDNTTCEDWLPTFGNTTVYKLVERILQSK